MNKLLVEKVCGIDRHTAVEEWKRFEPDELDTNGT